MKILLLTQWFDPEPTFKGLLFAQALRAEGHEVEVLTGFKYAIQLTVTRPLFVIRLR